MSVNSDEAFKIAATAIEKLAKDRGVEARFPFDAIWKYADKEVNPKLYGERKRSRGEVVRELPAYVLESRRLGSHDG